MRSLVTRWHRTLWVLWSSTFIAIDGSAVNQDALREEAPADDTGTAEQLDWLVDNYGRLVFRIAFAITHNEALAEDVVQDTMFKAWTSMPSWDGDVPVRWLRVVARNTAISMMRRESRSDGDEDWDRRVSTAPGTERVVEGRSLVAAVAVAFQSLDEASRTMIVLRETDELSYDEIGETLGLTTQAVKAKLYRARHQLKVLLREWDI